MILVGAWIASPQVDPVAPSKGRWPVPRILLRLTGTAGNPSSDARIPAKAIQRVRFSAWPTKTSIVFPACGT